MLNFEQIKDLVELVADRRLGKLTIERSGFRLEIEGSAAARPVAEAAPVAHVPVAHVAEAEASPAAAAPAEEAPAAAAEAAAEDDLPAGAHVMNSPIVGTFYRSPSPDAAPFVEIGDQVDQGEVVCIVEAMKLMNEIEADVGGSILRIFPQNGQPVEFGERLFAIKPR